MSPAPGAAWRVKRSSNRPQRQVLGPDACSLKEIPWGLWYKQKQLSTTSVNVGRVPVTVLQRHRTDAHNAPTPTFWIQTTSRGQR